MNGPAGPRKKMKALAAMLLAGVFWLATFAPGYAEESPTTTVQKSVREIYRLLADENLAQPENWPQREQLVLDVVRQGFDFHKMSRGVLARYWRNMSAAERDEFVALFSEFLKNIYIRVVEAYSYDNLTFVNESLDVRGKGDKMVEVAEVTSLAEQRNVTATVVYKMAKDSGKWMVYDVVIENISQIAKFRAEFADITNRKKYDKLVADLHDKINQRKSELKNNGNI